jgi:hypothetical protein
MFRQETAEDLVIGRSFVTFVSSCLIHLVGRRNLAKPGSLERSCPHEIMGLGRKESSFDHACHSHRRRRDCFRVDRAARANARGLLGCDRNIGRDAIHSRRDADAFDRADRRHCRGRISRSARGKFFAAQTSSRSRLQSSSSDCSRSHFVWRRLRIVTPALPSPSSF